RLKLRMKDEAINRFQVLRVRQEMNRLEFLAQIEEKIGGGVRFVGEGIEHAILFADEEAVTTGTASKEQGMMKLQFGKGAHDLEGWRWFRGADDLGGCPGRPCYLDRRLG